MSARDIFVIQLFISFLMTSQCDVIFIVSFFHCSQWKVFCCTLLLLFCYFCRWRIYCRLETSGMEFFRITIQQLLAVLNTNFFFLLLIFLVVIAHANAGFMFKFGKYCKFRKIKFHLLRRT